MKAKVAATFLAAVVVGSCGGIGIGVVSLHYVASAYDELADANAAYEMGFILGKCQERHPANETALVSCVFDEMSEYAERQAEGGGK